MCLMSNGLESDAKNLYALFQRSPCFLLCQLIPVVIEMHVLISMILHLWKVRPKD